jgi:hypothetical protein
MNTAPDTQKIYTDIGELSHAVQNNTIQISDELQDVLSTFGEDFSAE